MKPSVRNIRRGFVVLTSISCFSLITLRFLGYTPRADSPLPDMPSMSNPRVVLRQGTIIGIKVDSYGNDSQPLDMFLGIPYALSTDGPRRFREAVPIEKSEGIFDAGKYGQRCPAGVKDDTPMGEDCLNLNIYRPTRRKNAKKLPVLVYIHGGSFNFGAGNTRQISSMVAWSTKPMIGISFNYRLGAFGFLSSKVMKDEGVLNLGLRDQSLLLRWVKENIDAFGGDPDDVTIMGSSAGAHSVGHHLLYKTDEPALFHKAIIESGGSTARQVLPYNAPIQEIQSNEFLSNLNLANVPREKLISSLQALPVTKIKDASELVYNKYDASVRWPWQPVIDGEGGFIRVAPITALKSGKWHQVPLLTGYNTNEGAIFINPKISTPAQFTSFFHTLLPNLSSDDLFSLNAVYPDPSTKAKSPYIETRTSLGLGAQFTRTEQAYGHFAYVAPVRQTAQYVSISSPVWLYHFAVNSRKEGGADHGSHNNFVTYSKEIRDISPSIREISAKMLSYWTSFITTGDPNTEEGIWKERATWPQFVGDVGRGGKVAVFGMGNNEMAGGSGLGKAVEIIDDMWVREECRYWEERTELFES